MTQVGMQEAQEHLSELVKRAQAGEEIVIAVSGEPAARLVPCEKPERRRPTFGLDAGKFTIPDDFDVMSEEELAEWYTPLDE